MSAPSQIQPADLLGPWQSAWPQALAAWSAFTRLRAPLLLTASADAEAEGLRASFAMIRLADQTVVIDLAQIADQRLQDHAVAVLAHEIGHHVYAPGSLSDHVRCLARMQRGLGVHAQHAPLIANLYTDLLINDRLQRSAGLAMDAVFRILASTRTEGPPSRVWQVYMRSYEILWSLPRHTLAPGTWPDEAEGDAQLAARLVRHYACDWLAGAGGFAVLMYPWLEQDAAHQALNQLDHWQDTRAAALGGEVHGLSRMEPAEADSPLHPASDPALHEGLLGGAVAGPGPGQEPAATAASARNASGQTRTPYQYGELLRLAGLPIDDHEAAVRFYREQAEPHLVPFPARARPRVMDLLPEGLETWDLGLPLDQIDWLGSVTRCPTVIPGLTTLRRVHGDSEGPLPRPKPLDLDLYVDSSGSMPHPQRELSWPALAGAILCLSALRAGARVQVTLWSGKHQVLSTHGYVRDRHAILRVLTGYFGGGTQFPLPVLRELHARRKPGDPPAHILCVSDDGASTMFDTPDERGVSGFEVCATALAQAGGGGTLVLNLPANWEHHSHSWMAKATATICQARDAQGWDVHAVANLDGLLDFARVFARRHYLAPATPAGLHPP